MEQPSGFKDSKFSDSVCHFNKVIYGLKQVPRAWFEKFNSYLLQYGFQCSTADPSLFIFHLD